MPGWLPSQGITILKGVLTCSTKPGLCTAESSRRHHSPELVLEEEEVSSLQAPLLPSCQLRKALPPHRKEAAAFPRHGPSFTSWPPTDAPTRQDQLVAHRREILDPLWDGGARLRREERGGERPSHTGESSVLLLLLLTTWLENIWFNIL